MGSGTLRSTFLAGLAFAAACSPSTTNLSGDCARWVRVGDVTYNVADRDPGLADFEPGEPYDTVTLLDPVCRDLVVNGEIVNSDGFGSVDGESNFLPEGTLLYTQPGHDPAERLIVRLDDGWRDTDWVALEPLPRSE